MAFRGVRVSPKPDEPTWSFADLFDLEEIQQLQDKFATTHNVASIITDPAGNPITRPSNFRRLCREIMGNVPEGHANCLQVESARKKPHLPGPVVKLCPSGGLWDGGASICVGEQHLANWVVGQVRNENLDEEQVNSCAQEMGADVKAFHEALAEIPVMSQDRFEEISFFLYDMAALISRQAVQNAELKQVLAAKCQVEEERDSFEQHLRLTAGLEALGRLASGVAHDFGNLLTAIQGYAEVMIENTSGPTDPSTPPYRILSAAEHASELVTSLLDFARQHPGRMEPVHLGDVVNETVSMLKHSLPSNIKVNMRMPAFISPVMGNSSSLQSALLNLGVNAGHAMPRGGQLDFLTRLRHLADNLEGVEPGAYVEVQVRDSGEGMDEETLQQIFEPFFSKRTGRHGTGLGLTRVYSCIKSHKGSIDVQSEVGVGTVVTILLPVTAVPSGLY